MLSGGHLAPGNSPSVIYSGSFNLASGASLDIEIQSPGTTAGTDYDQVKVTGTVTLAGGLHTSFLGGFTPATGQTFKIIDNDGTADAVNGSFANVGATFTQGGNTYSINYAGGDGNDVVVTALNDAPVLAGDLAITVPEGGSVAVTTNDLTATDIDNSNPQLVYTLTAASHGTVLRSGATLALNGTFTQADLAANLISFQHDGNEADGSFTVSLTDGTAAAQSTTVNTTVNPHVNDAPTSVGHNYTLGVDGPLTVAAAQGLLSGASDPENDPFSALVVTGPAHGTLSLNSDGSFVYKAANTFFGEDSFSFKANDGALDGNVSTVKIDVAREKSSETTTNPGGGSTTTYYDAKHDKAWISQNHNFDSNGNETSATVSYDDGSMQGATFDANNNQPWKSQSSVTNAQGQVTNMGVIYDDGTQQIAIFDAGNNQPWLSQHAVYDALGRQTTLGVIYDDGTQQSAIFDAASNQPWTSQNMVYDALGRLTTLGVIYDDGHTEMASYDTKNDKDWASQSAVYDANAHIIASSVTYDDGHVVRWHI